MDKILFQEKLIALGKVAEEAGSRITVEEVQEFFKDMDLLESHFELIYGYLAEKKITVVGYVQPEVEKEEIPLTEEEEHFLKVYKVDLKHISKMKKKDVDALYEAVAKDDEGAKAQLMEQWLLKVLEIADEFRGKGVLLQDLVQEGNLGLMLALSSMPMEMSGNGVEGFLKEQVETAIQNALGENIRDQEADTVLVKKMNAIGNVIETLSKELDRKVGIEEVSAYMDISVEEIEDLLKLAGETIEVEDEHEDHEHCGHEDCGHEHHEHER